ncbi:nucleotidyltransferase domain-containing protein [Micromonospora sp. WMMD1082]|uniref:nucleotidyltransferase domain-containing protein n=1 Tax=Micromonospora sp. WMMD1082 TaxID=3016104 RepID=UPI00241774FA|nr:nucleotidyltransferase domain-containing protein [Micromonospora sp. WMMD1082]MDG4798283.1 nucleotidyltransferase domain-containing protein [Micromonospora sp. WMMD1082]
MVDLPQTVTDVTARYLELVDRQLPGLVAGLHLVGSVALDDYQESRSDIDIVAVTTRPLSGAVAGSVAWSSQR